MTNLPIFLCVCGFEAFELQTLLYVIAPPVVLTTQLQLVKNKDHAAW